MYGADRKRLNMYERFEWSKLNMRQIVKLMYYWCLKLENKSIMIDMNLASDTVLNWKNFCREVYLELCVRENYILGGNEVIVEVDESKFGKWKYQREKHSDRISFFFVMVPARKKVFA